MGKYTWHDIPRGYVLDVRVPTVNLSDNKVLIYDGIEFSCGTHGQLLCEWIEYQLYVKVKRPHSWDKAIDALIEAGYCLHFTNESIPVEGYAIWRIIVVKALSDKPVDLRELYTQKLPVIE